MKESNREIAEQIIDLFEQLLEKYNLDIPSKDRDAEPDKENLAHIYGEEYYDLEDAIVELLEKETVNVLTIIDDETERITDTYVFKQGTSIKEVVKTMQETFEKEDGIRPYCDIVKETMATSLLDTNEVVQLRW